MVLFLVPAVVSLFTGIIGGVTYHFVRRNNAQNANNQTQHRQIQVIENKQNVQNKKSQQNSRQIQLQKMPNPNNFTLKQNKNSSEQAIEETRQVSNKKQQNCEEKKFMCPLTNQVINKPAQLFCGHCFQKQNLIKYIKENKKCPVCDKKSRLSEIVYPQEFNNILQQYKQKKRVRKLSRDRLIQDFGDDLFELIVRRHEDQKALSDTEGNEEKQKQVQQVKLTKYCSINQT